MSSGHPMIGVHTKGDFYAEPIVGYRTWRVDDEALALKGTVVNYAWPTGDDATAICKRQSMFATEAEPHHPSVVPVEDCYCGFYGYWDYATLQRKQACIGSPIAYVRGAVIAWGKCWLAERGWRAKHARPVALLHWPERRVSLSRPFEDRDAELAMYWTDAIARTAERYGIPVVNSPDELEQAVRDYV